MSGTGKVLLCGPVTIEDDRHVCKILTDAAGDNTVYIPRDGPRPLDGTVVTWTTSHVQWQDALGHAQRVRKIGYACNDFTTEPYSAPVPPPS